jgi:hypothetical protein
VEKNDTIVLAPFKKSAAAINSRNHDCAAPRTSNSPRPRLFIDDTSILVVGRLEPFFISLEGVLYDAKSRFLVPNEIWHHPSGPRTHLRLSNLTYLSSDIEPIDEAFIDTISPLQQVTSLDCSMVPPPPPPPSVHCADTDEEGLRQNNNNQPRRSWFLSRYEDYVDKGFAQGLTLSLLVPNLQSIDMSYLPLTMIGVAWLTENNPHLKVIRWNHSLIWPVSNDSEHHLEALKYLKEVYLDEARILFCQDNLNEESLWNSLLDHIHGLERVSLLGTRWYRKGKLAELSQGYLVKFVRGTPSLKWFRSDLSPANVDLLRKERPQVMFVSSS